MSLTNINTGNQGLEKNIKNGDRDLSQLLKSKSDTANVGLGNVFANIVTQTEVKEEQLAKLNTQNSGEYVMRTFLISICLSLVI